MRFDDLAEINPSVPIRKGDIRPFIDMSALPQHARDVSELDEREFKGSGSRFQNGDTLIARITPCLENGKGALVHSLPDGLPGFGSTEFIVARARSERDTRFVYYLTRSEEFREIAISRMEGTSGRQRVSWQQIASIEIPDLRPDEREEIGHTLGTLDDKIEMNRRMAATLEEMARALYRSWFVDFDPVKAKAEGLAPAFMDEATAALFPDRFGDDGLPDGWRRGCLTDVAINPRTGVKPEQIDPSTPYIGLEHMPRRSIRLGDWGTAEDVGSQKSAMRRGDFLFGKLRPYFHKVGISPVDGICSTDIIVVRPKAPEWASFVLSVISSDNFVEHTNAGSSGTRMPRTNWGEMGRYEVVIPPVPVAAAFEAALSAMRDRIVAGVHEARTLATLRDTLLPKLMCGELRVGEARDQIEAVA